MCDSRGAGTCSCSKPDYCKTCGYCNNCGGYKSGSRKAAEVGPRTRTVPCRRCQAPVVIPVRRGRPWVICAKCRGS
jgi:hypothetical protein